MTIFEYLHAYVNDPVPAWLAGFTPGQPFNRTDFFNSRVVYYPGSGDDGHPVKAFGSTGSAHCFVYADYRMTQQAVEMLLDNPVNGFRGYSKLDRIQLRENDLTPHGWKPHMTVAPDYRFVQAPPFGFCEILERKRGISEDHGPSRLAIIFLGADGIATYDALFCQSSSIPAPWAMVLQDHGFGGNYDCFGAGGLLAQLAADCQVFPSLMLVGHNTQPWAGYTQIPNVDAVCGGTHGTPRSLYKFRL